MAISTNLIVCKGLWVEGKSGSRGEYLCMCVRVEVAQFGPI